MMRETGLPAGFLGRVLALIWGGFVEIRWRGENLNEKNRYKDEVWQVVFSLQTALGFNKAFYVFYLD
jgi:hypothetical protein